MALTKQLVIDRIEILEDGTLQVRQRLTALDDDGSKIGERYNRYVLTPGQDVTAQPTRIRQIAGVVWTPQVIADYQAKQAAALAALRP